MQASLNPIKRVKNQRRIFVDFNGKQISLIDFQKLTRISISTLYREVRIGKTAAEIVKKYYVKRQPNFGTIWPL